MSTHYDTRESGEYVRETISPPTTKGSLPVAAFKSQSAVEQVPAIEALKIRLAEERLTRIGLKFLDACLPVEWMDDDRRMRVGGREVVNFGSDSFLALDRDPRVQRALVQSIEESSTHDGAARALSSVALQLEAERRLADWLDVDDTLIFPSVTLANVGLLPAIAGKGDLLVVDRTAHGSVQQAAKIAAGNGATLRELNPCRGATLRKILEREDYDGCVMAVDGVCSITGIIPPLDELNEAVREFGGVLYVDDSHGTAVVGPGGRGATNMILGSLDDVLMVGSLSEAFSCLGAFVTCDKHLKRILKTRSNTFPCEGPVPPFQLAAICAACEIIDSPEYDQLIGHVRSLVRRLMKGIQSIGLTAIGREAAMIAVTVGDIERTLKAGKWLFDRGYYVRSATYPTVSGLSGLLRIQVNANHSADQIDGLLNALADLKRSLA